MGSSAYEDMKMYRNVFVPAGSTVYLDEEYSSEDFRLELTPSEFVYEVYDKNITTAEVMQK